MFLHSDVTICMKTVFRIKVSYLEGQLNSSRKTIERLEQELKKSVFICCQARF